jgi:hypothetical protein
MVKIAGLTLGVKLSSAVLSFLLIVAISQWLGAEDRGYCGFYLVVVSSILVISDFAGGAASAFLLQTYSPAALHRFQMVWSVWPSVLVPIVFVFTKQIGLQEALILMLAGWLHAGWSMQQYLWLGLKKFRVFNFFIMAAPVLSLFFFIGLWSSGLHDKMAYLFAITLSWSFCFAVSSWLFWRSPVHSGMGMEAGGYKKVLGAGGMNQMVHVVGLVNSRLMFFILPAGLLGIYANALTLAEASFMVSGSLGQVVYSLTASPNEEDYKNKVLRVGWWGNGVLMLAGCLVLFIAPDSLFQAVFGSSFAGMGYFLRLLIGGMFLYSQFLLLSYWQSAYGRFVNNFRAILVGFVINAMISLFLYFSDNYNVANGALALCIGWMVTGLMAFVLFYRETKSMDILLKLPGKRTIEGLLKNLKTSK